MPAGEDDRLMFGKSSRQLVVRCRWQYSLGVGAWRTVIAQHGRAACAHCDCWPEGGEPLPIGTSDSRPCPSIERLQPVNFLPGPSSATEFVRSPFPERFVGVAHYAWVA